MKRPLIIKISLIDGAVMEVWSDDMHFAQMATTRAVLANTHLWVMMSKVDIEQFALSPSKVFTVDDTCLFPGWCHIARHWSL